MKIIVLKVLICFILVSHAFGAEKDENFKQGEKYFKLKNYKKTVETFNKLLDKESSKAIKAKALLFVGKSYY